MSFSTFKEYKLDNISLAIKTGKTPPASIRKYLDKNEEGANFIGSKSIFDGFIDKESIINLNKQSERFLSNCSLEEDDILLNVTGDGVTFGRNAIVTKDILPSYVSQNIAIIRLDKSRVNPKFLMYYLIMPSMKEYINGMSSGSARRAISAKNIKELKVKIPPLQEQKSIAQMLTSLDEKIQINNKINKTLESMAQEIFKHWFVDFEFPNEDGEPYKSSGGEMVESELGMIPKGWEVKSLDQIAEYLNGLAMQKFRPNDNEKGVPVLKIKELRQCSTDSSSDLCSPSIESKYIINDGDVIFSWSGSLLVDIWCGGKCGLNQHLFKVTSTRFDKWFYYYWTKFHLEKFIGIAESKATTMGHIKRQDLSDSFVLIPDSAVYKMANSIISSLLENQIGLRVESRQLTTIRDTLLPKLMSGEIRVPPTEEG
jgi:type I restriction enzyme, S subunit